jgi:hypothetical protein
MGVLALHLDSICLVVRIALSKPKKGALGQLSGPMDWLPVVAQQAAYAWRSLIVRVRADEQ